MSGMEREDGAWLQSGSVPKDRGGGGVQKAEDQRPSEVEERKACLDWVGWRGGKVLYGYGRGSWGDGRETRPTTT